MSGNDDRRRDGRRGTILVASPSPAFVEIVGEMIVGSGFGFATTMQAEPTWPSVTRTPPVLVICDGGMSGDVVRRLIAETDARRVPLMLLGMTGEQKSASRGRSLPTGMAWLQFPLAREVFQSALDELLTPTRSVGRQVVLSGAGVTMDVGFAT